MIEQGRVADGNEGHLAGNLNAEDEQCAAVDAQSFRGKGEQLGVRRKDSGKSLREQHDARPEQDGIGQAGLEQRKEGFFDAGSIFAPKL